MAGTWRKDPKDTPCKGNKVYPHHHSSFVDDEGRCEWCGKRINTPGYGESLTVPEELVDLRIDRRFGAEEHGDRWTRDDQLADCPAHPGVPLIECDVCR